MIATKSPGLGGVMGSPIDPEGIEIKEIHELVDYSDADVLEVGCGDGRLTGDTRIKQPRCSPST